MRQVAAEFNQFCLSSHCCVVLSLLVLHLFGAHLSFHGLCRWARRLTRRKGFHHEVGAQPAHVPRRFKASAPTVAIPGSSGMAMENDPFGSLNSPLKMVIFHIVMLVCQRVPCYKVSSFNLPIKVLDCGSWSIFWMGRLGPENWHS